MTTLAHTFTNVTVSTDQNTPTVSPNVTLKSTAVEAEMLMSPHNVTQSWTQMMGAGVLTIALQKQQPDTSWLNVVSSTFDSGSFGKDGRTLFSVGVAGLGNAVCRLAAWCTTIITIDATITETF